MPPSPQTISENMTFTVKLCFEAESLTFSCCNLSSVKSHGSDVPDGSLHTTIWNLLYGNLKTKVPLKTSHEVKCLSSSKKI